MNTVDLEEVKKIILQLEKNSRYNDRAIIERLSEYGISRSVTTNKPDEVSKRPEDVFIRCLAISNARKDFKNFPELLDKLADTDSKLIKYLIARNENTSDKTLLKIVMSNPPSESILNECQKNTKDFTILETIYNRGTIKNKIEVLNNIYFKDNPKSYEYYLLSFAEFDDFAFEKINSQNLPDEVKEEYLTAKRKHYLHSYITELTQTYEVYSQAGEETLLNELLEEINTAQQEYDALNNNGLKQ